MFGALKANILIKMYKTRNAAEFKKLYVAFLQIKPIQIRIIQPKAPIAKEVIGFNLVMNFLVPFVFILESLIRFSVRKVNNYDYKNW